MWALLTPLDHFEAYAEKNLLATCRRFHDEWGLDEPLATYAVAYDYFFCKYIASKYLYVGHILPPHCFFRGGLSVGSPPNRFSNLSKFLIPPYTQWGKCGSWDLASRI
jgi:hypothetical protein